MGYTPGFEGPHPSQLPAADWGIDEGPDPCGHNGCLDSWRGDDTTGPGYVWSCMLKCGAPGSQVYYPDEVEPQTERTPRVEVEG